MAACVGLLGLFLAGCGGGPEGSPSGAASADEFPEPDGRTVEEVLAAEAGGEEVVLAPSGRVHREGRQRLGFGLFELGGESIGGAEAVAIYLSPPGEPAIGPFPARRESLTPERRFNSETTYADEQSVYVSEVKWPQAGEYRLGALVRRDGEWHGALQAGPVVVGAYDGIPAPGDAAPRVSTPTEDDVVDVSEIDTREPPSTMHEEDLAEVLGERPVVLLFATPALCQTRVCGPVTDIAEQVKQTAGHDEVAFIHMEIYNENRVEAGVRPQVRAFGLETEPWLFVIDRLGTVRTAIEGAFSARELEAAIEEVT